MTAANDPLPPFHGTGGRRLRLGAAAAAAAVLVAAAGGYLAARGGTLALAGVALAAVAAVLAAAGTRVVWRAGVEAALREVRVGLRELVRDNAGGHSAVDRILGD